jgi:IS5 family transposase
MRKTVEPQKKLGQIDISKIQFDLRCRDEIPKVLMGLQQIYCDHDIREKVFKLLQELIPPNIDTDNGRPGMELWKILVLGCVRLTCNWDYDKLHDIANNHEKIREMLGHGVMDKGKKYPLQTLKDNISLFTPEILDRINQIVVEYGHRLLQGKKNEKLKLNGRCDSFVVETDVHFPTDINLLSDAIRKIIILIRQSCGKSDILGWRNSADNIKKVKKLFHKVRRLKHSTSKNDVRIAQQEEQIKQAHQSYIALIEILLDRATESLLELKIKGNGNGNGIFFRNKILEIEGYMEHAYRQIDQIRRRVIHGESIEHHEKVFSIFERHTEWISKGKAGVAQELGLRVCILEDQYGFVLHNRVMEKETDDKVAVPMVVETKKKYPNLRSCSFDKGFYSPDNQQRLSEVLEFVILPKKGKLSESDKEVEYSEEFVTGRRQHSAVESAINGLENHGLDRCLDHGIYGFKRYVSFAVLARNIEKLGTLIRNRQLKGLKRESSRIKLREQVRIDKAA